MSVPVTIGQGCGILLTAVAVQLFVTGLSQLGIITPVAAH
jgi:small neutral amino acid transporter SnatA (MarC family)